MADDAKPPPIPLTQPITLKLFRKIEAAVREAGYSDIIDNTEVIDPPDTPEELASRAIYVIANSGMRNSIAAPIAERVMVALHADKKAKSVFGHPGKVAAMQWIWKHRRSLYKASNRTWDTVEWCGTLPWIGIVTKYHLAKNLGIDVAKPDVHMERLAQAEGIDTHDLCARLARQTGYRVATVDTILWRACADGIIDSQSVAPKLAKQPKVRKPKKGKG